MDPLDRVQQGQALPRTSCSGLKLCFQKKKKSYKSGIRMEGVTKYICTGCLLSFGRLHQGVRLQHNAGGHSRLCTSFYLISDDWQCIRCGAGSYIGRISKREQLQSKANMAGCKMCKAENLQLLQAFSCLRWLYCQCNSVKCHSNLTSYCFC